MKQFLTVATIGALVLLVILGQVNPESSLLLMAATGEEYIYVRLGLVLILMSLLLYRPPRALGFRIGLVGVAMLLAGSTVAMLASYSLQPFDALLFLETTILLCIEAAELGGKREVPVWTRAKTVPTRSTKLQTAQ